MQHEFVGKVENTLGGGETEGVGLAHEARADEADPELPFMICH
jgi:hypothetical protein